MSTAERRGGDVQATAIEPAHGDLEAVAFAAEAIFSGYAHAVEHDGAGRLHVPAHLLLVGAEGQARRILLDDEGRDPLGAVFAGARHDHIEAGFTGAGDELFLAGQHIAVAVLDRLCLQRRRIEPEPGSVRR